MTPASTTLAPSAMNLSPTSDTASTSSSSISNATLHPNYALPAAYRRRSVDTGGLNLVVNDHSGSGSGRGYGGWDTDPTQALPGSIDVAELVLAMREQTNTTIDHAYPATSTTFRPSSEMGAQKEFLVRKLATWRFDASHLPPDEVLMCTSLLFESLWCIDGMEDSISLAFGEHAPCPVHPRRLALVAHSPCRFNSTFSCTDLQNLPRTDFVPQLPARPRRAPGGILLSHRGRLRAQRRDPPRARAGWRHHTLGRR